MCSNISSAQFWKLKFEYTVENHFFYQKKKSSKFLHVHNNFLRTLYCKPVKWLPVLLFNTYYFTEHYLFICAQSNGLKYCYVSLTIQVDSNFFTQLNDQQFLFLAI